MSLPQMPTDRREMRTSRGPSFSSSATSRRARRSFSSRTSAFIVSSSSASCDDPTDDERNPRRRVQRNVRLQKPHPEPVDGDEDHHADEDAVEQFGPDRQEAAAVLANPPGRLARHRYSFTAPNVSPATIWCCTSPRNRRAGSSVSVAVAAICPQLVPVTVTNSARPVVIVLACTLVSG